nr:hypothetical protein [Tanacetum cinerariifolium]
DDDDDDKDEEPFEDEEDDEEEEEHLAPVDYSDVPIVDPVLQAGDTEALEADKPAPIPYHLILLSFFPRHVSADVPPRKRACLTTLAPGVKVEESSAAGAARQPGPTDSDLWRRRVEQTGYGITDTWDEIVDTLMEMALTTLEGDDRALLRAQVNTLFRDRPDHRRTAMLLDKEAMYARETQLTTVLGRIEIQEARDLEPQEGPAEAGSIWLSCMIIDKMVPKKRTTIATPATTTVTNAQLQALIDRGVAAALAERDVDRSRNGDNNIDSGTCGRRKVTTQRECTYTDLLKCQPMSFQGTEGVVGPTQ